MRSFHPSFKIAPTWLLDMTLALVSENVWRPGWKRWSLTMSLTGTRFFVEVSRTLNLPISMAYLRSTRKAAHYGLSLACVSLFFALRGSHLASILAPYSEKADSYVERHSYLRHWNLTQISSCAVLTVSRWRLMQYLSFESKAALKGKGFRQCFLKS